MFQPLKNAVGRTILDCCIDFSLAHFASTKHLQTKESSPRAADL
jgi:hypothetical protein